MLFTGIDWNTVRGVFGGKGVFKGISYLSVSDGHRYQVLAIISHSSKFLRHRILEALDGLQDDLLSDSGLQVFLQSTAIRFFGSLRKPHNRVKSPRVTWAALKLNMMFI